jgi:hypothetical protein
MTIGNRRFSADILAVLLLIALCWLFNWRLLTPNTLNQQSLVEGDFSGQFVAFAHYQAVRFAQAEVPLWNPYNYGGHPFLADTQAAAFYPPRLITIGALNITGGSTPQRMYYALEVEMIAHMLLASLFMYALLRRLTLRQPYSVAAGLIAGITFAYSGYLTGYPQLQLAVMEAGVWLPLTLLGIHEATRDTKVRWHWFILAGIALGISLTAGHPQTALFFVYVSTGYLAYQTATQHLHWRTFILGTLIFGLIGAGLAAVQLLPGWEYTRLTVRTTLSFDAMGNGFPFYDVLQMLFPGMLSLWSPLFVGIVPLALAIYAIARRVNGAIFWLIVTVIAFALSFGQGTIFYDLVYNIVPGFSLFRGQERSAYVIAVSLSILTGLGTNVLLSSDANLPRYRFVLWGLFTLAFVLGMALFINWLLVPGTSGKYRSTVWFSVLIAGSAILLITNVVVRWEKLRQVQATLLIVVVVFELFSVSRSNPNLEVRPAGERLQEPTLAQAIRTDVRNDVYRADLTRAIGENYGTLYGIMDTQGISPLRLLSVDRLLKLPVGRLWEAFSVRYIPTTDNELPVPSTIIAKDESPQTTINLHKLTDPRPFARLVYRTWIESDDNAALGIITDPSYDARNTVMLPAEPKFALPASVVNGTASITRWSPESITVQTSSPDPAILSVSLIYYPGWQATIDGQPASLLRADTAFTALALPSGDHTIQLDYRPASYQVGSLITLATLVVVALGALSGLAPAYFAKSANRRSNSESARS